MLKNCCSFQPVKARQRGATLEAVTTGASKTFQVLLSIAFSSLTAFICCLVMLFAGVFALLRIPHNLFLISLAGISSNFLAPSSNDAAISFSGILLGVGTKFSSKVVPPFVLHSAGV